MFIANVTKPCSKCGIPILKGTSEGFTWDRANGGYVHTACTKSGAKIVTTTAVAVHTNGNGNGHNADQAETLVKALQALIVTPGIDEKEVRRIAAEEASKVASVSRSIEIKVGEMPKVKLSLAHKDIGVLVKLLSTRGHTGHRLNVYMHGPAGSGKSSGAQQVSEVFQDQYGYMALNPQTPDSRILGYMNAVGVYVESEFFKRYTQGGTFCFDEIDNAASSLVTTLNGMLENGHGAFPHGVFPRHPDFVCVVTANTIGRGGNAQYPERRQLDGAFLERFVFLSWQYDTALTRAIVSAKLGDKTDEFIQWLDEEAEELVARFPTLIVSPRAYILGSTLKQGGFTDEQIIDMVVAKGLREGVK